MFSPSIFTKGNGMGESSWLMGLAGQQKWDPTSSDSPDEQRQKLVRDYVQKGHRSVFSLTASPQHLPLFVPHPLQEDQHFVGRVDCWLSAASVTCTDENVAAI